MVRLSRVSFLFFILPVYAFSQTEIPRPSLRTLPADQRIKDSIKIKQQLDAARYYLSKPGDLKRDVDSAQVKIKGALGLSQKIYAVRWENESLKLLAESYCKLNDLATAKTFFLKAIAGYRQEGAIGEEAQAWQRFADVWPHFTPEQLADQRSAYFHASLLYKKLHHTEEQLTADKEIADIDLKSGKYDLAEQELLAVISESKRTPYKKLPYTYDLLGGVYRLNGNSYRELYYRIQAIKSMNENRDLSGAMEFYCRLAGTYFDLGQYDKSLENIKKALTFRSPSPDYQFFVQTRLVRVLVVLKRPKEALALLNGFVRLHRPDEGLQQFFANTVYGDCYSALGDFSNAEKYYLKTVIKFSDDRVTESAFERITEFYLKFKQYRTAQYYTNVLLSLPQQNMTPSALRQIHLFKFKTDSAFGNYSAAIIQFQKYKQVNDSIFNLNKVRAMSEMEVKYETEKKERSIALLKSQEALQQADYEKISLQRNLMFCVCFLLLMTVGLAYYGFRLYKRTARKLQLKQSEINSQNESLQILNDRQQKLLTEKEWLLREVHHRVKNNLQTTISLLNWQSSFLTNEDAVDAIQNSQSRIQAMSLIHQKLYQGENLRTINMKAYIEELVSYLQDSFISSKDIKFELLLQHVELDIAKSIPIGLIINEAVTNSIKHAFPDTGKGKISINLDAVAADNYVLSIADDGVGYPEVMTAETNNSLGMNLIKGLVRQIQGTLDMEGSNGMRIGVGFNDVKVALGDAIDQDYISSPA
ncbi:tetratricopeptide repeat-containing sensor histidine kinase [Mucilaginibacter kameinonensis]|uniref:tetratricopeptide repeat-containing sensor histidine kinase n=1 Tax=Mucilaginibacter kameinonensis TaxID=452286 RepID=UPI0013CEFD42|nr:histidine kinase dimerization/phosphoacceptor domain -containing protein [Mucilaginibacter kameinonensis]